MQRVIAATALASLTMLPVGTADAKRPGGFVLTAVYNPNNIAGPAVMGMETPPNADIGPPLVFHDARIESKRPWQLEIEIEDQTGGSVFALADIGPKTEVPFCTTTEEPIVVPPRTDEIEVSLYDGTCAGAAPSVVTTGTVTLTFHY